MTGDDWRLPRLVATYRGHVSVFIAAQLAAAAAASASSAVAGLELPLDLASDLAPLDRASVAVVDLKDAGSLDAGSGAEETLETKAADL